MLSSTEPYAKNAGQPRSQLSGTPVGTEFRINTVTAGHQYMPAVSAQPSGGFVVVFAQQESPQTTFTDVWARRYGPFGGGAGDLIFKDGFEAGP